MDGIIFVIVAAVALGYFTPLGTLYIGIIGGIINILFNWDLFQAVVEPPWWAQIFGLYNPIQLINTGELVSCFIYGAAVAGALALVLKLFRRFKK